MKTIKSFFINLVSMFFIWTCVALVDLYTADSNDALSMLAVLTALGTSVALWTIWALSASSNSSPETGKAKRSPSEDTRLSLLLEMMGDDERQALKQRLTTDLQADGEAYSLVDLLAAQERRSNR